MYYSEDDQFFQVLPDKHGRHDFEILNRFNERPRNSPCVSVGMDSGTERQLGPVCFL